MEGSDGLHFGVDNGIVVIGASKCSRERIVNTLGIVKRHLNNIKNKSPVDRTCNEEDDSEEGFTWRTSPIKPMNHVPPPVTAPHHSAISTPGRKVKGKGNHLLRSFSSEYSPFDQNHSPSPRVKIHRQDSFSSTSKIHKFTLSTPVIRTLASSSSRRLLHTKLNFDEELHSCPQPSPNTDNSFHSMDVDILGVSLVVEDISSIMNRMTLFVDPNCGNLLRFSSDQPLLGSSLLTLATRADLEEEMKKKTGEINKKGNAAVDANISVICHSATRMSSLLNVCHKEDQRLSGLVNRGEVDGVLCMQTDVEELLHSKTIRASIDKGLPIVAVGLASAQQIISMGGKVIACYDLSLAPLASSSAPLSPFLLPANSAGVSDTIAPGKQVMTASYSYFLPEEQLCDESLGYYVASSFASHWREDKSYSIPQPRSDLIVNNIVRRTFLLLGFITLFHWILECCRLALNTRRGPNMGTSLLTLLNPIVIVHKPYPYFAMLIFSYTCLHFAYPTEDYSFVNSREVQFHRKGEQRQSGALRSINWHFQFIFYKHSRKYVFRLLATAFLFVILLKYSLFSLLLTPVTADDANYAEINVCARYALTLAFGFGALCGTMQYFTKLLLSKIMRKSYRSLCDLVSISLSFLATGVLVMLIVRSFKINLYQALMLKTEKDINFFDHLSKRVCGEHYNFHSASECTVLSSVHWLQLFEHNVVWFLPPAFSRFLVTIGVALLHLFDVCTTQLMDMFNLSARGVESKVCATGSFLWRLSPDEIGFDDNVPPVFGLLVIIILAVFCILVSCCSVFYIESRRFHILLIPALLLDMDQLTSEITISADRQETFYRTKAICCLYMPYAGVIGAIAIRSIIRTESLFMYYDYLHLFIDRHLKKKQFEDVLVTKSFSEGTPLILRDMVSYFYRVLLSVVGDTDSLQRMTNEEIEIDIGKSKAKQPLKTPELSPTDEDFEIDSNEITENSELRGSRARFDPLLLMRAVFMCLRSETSRLRVSRMFYDWMYMRDCMVELQLCSQQHYSLVKIVCLRVLPLFVAARIILLDGIVMEEDSFCQYFSFYLINESDKKINFCQNASLWSDILVICLKFILSSSGIFFFACVFTLVILCMPHHKKNN